MQWYSGNQLALLRSGTEYFPALLTALNAARHEIFLESYLYKPDKIGRQVSAALMRAARRGVSVQLLIDGFGARDLPPAFRESLAKAGVRLLFFRPEHSSFAINRQRLRRMHRKLVSIDGQLGFVGGINILEDHDGPDLAPRYDYALALRGPLTRQIRAAAAALWQQTCWSQFKMEWHRLPRRGTLPAPCGDIKAKLVKRDNLRHRRAIESAYLDAINKARQEVVIANAYFLPGISLRHALVTAAKRGVKVVILLQGRIDQALLHYATRVLYGPLLAAGVTIHEYTIGFMHAKVAVIDREWLTVGSSNIDPFSLLTAREANIVAMDKTLAEALRTDIQLHIDQHATTVHIHHVKRARWWQRALPWLAYQLVRGLMGLTGYGKREYRE
ncbi:cardiolipin synthase ClsB [Chitinimonas sp. BJB300]|uniref:cardiolipin synthase ClsB n=1 Tax=Chitinimonas sp. BJB300 TaxID=1559339 RepID=UPI000C10C0F2|nr:cardiolipin synthase ClsB [Chitinimonas sp. BJB300]PHV10677.1 cardiolipin synthase ClsB [Chitinimonas sp. BJB300]TSJ84500.1 cardiolipin synthase ClsB [Chitinimonas sp. BJB300]